MTQNENSRFSHITIGEIASAQGSQSEEEIIVISAPSPSLHDADIAQTSQGLEDLHASTQQSATERSIDDELAELNRPMPLMQKVVLVCCLIGFIVAIVFVTWFWLA